ncbi:hypothetical protein GIB67_007229 [Kingdonia uniflora]|uniref:Uncharacterized protein n=1 Tax=Kingdonia uniflora TaxID=39325 RepID=A0A7J7NXR4_9MAGN|nr:hypothetical protein GIB67_007229 [Kingdonia uniflora]
MLGEIYTWSWRLVVFLSKYTSHKEHLDGICSSGDKIYNVFDKQLPAALKRLQFDKQLSMETGPTEAAVNTVHAILKELVRKAISDTAAKQLSSLLNEDPTIMERRFSLSKRLKLYRSVEAEIDAAA